MRLQLRSLLAAVVVTLCSVPYVGAIDIVTPAGLNPGDSFRFLFLTSGTRDATSTNIADYNSFVTAQAAGYTYNGQSINWFAIGSTSTVNARDNIGGFNTSVPVYMTNGTKLANNLGTTSNGLWSGSLLAAPSILIDGTNGGGVSVFTGTAFNGTTSSAPLGDSLSAAGLSGQTGSFWLASGTPFSNTLTKKFYGISGTLTVPVPEPSTYALATIATGVMAAVARRRKARKA